jgi:hypothetical protein
MSRAEYEPTPAEIKAGTELVRQEWSEETHQRRAGKLPPPNPIPGREKYGLELSQEQRRQLSEPDYGGDS